MNNDATLIPEGYIPRLIEGRLDTLMRAFGCVEIAGAKWSGKTWTGLSRCTSVTKLDLPAEREAALVQPSLALVGSTPHLVDEWQEVPEVWDAARRHVDDASGERGLLVLTGSSALSKGARKKIRHSGTGRIARLIMRPMSLAESGDSVAAVSLRELFETGDVVPVRHESDVRDVARWCCRGGWPANIGLEDEIAYETSAAYVESVLCTNIEGEGKSPELALSLLRALAFNESQAVTYRTLRKDAGFDVRGIDDDTIASYIDLFKRMYLIEELPGWEPPMRAKARVRVKPKRMFVDPSLAAALLSATPDKLMHDMQTLGVLFENLVIRDLRVYLSTFGGVGDAIHYYRDDKGLEIDAIIEHAGSWAGVEIKLSDTKVDEAASNLLRARDKVLANPAAQNEAPVFLAVIVGAGSLAYRRDDGVLVIPANCLTA